MNRTLKHAIAVCGVAAGIATASDELAPEDIIILKYGNLVFVRSWFSPSQHVVTVMGKGGNNRQITFLGATLVDRDAPMTREGFESGTLIHSCGDDATPWNLNGTYIGGNHGASDVIRIESPVHGLTTEDIGSAWQDAAEVTFFVLRVFNPNEFLVMSENHGPAPFWKFTRRIRGAVLQATGSERTLHVAGQKLTQLWPACRINAQSYLIDGVADFPDTLPIRCGSLDIIEDYDIVCPDAVLASVTNNPGREADFVAKDLDAVVNNRILYRFYPHGVCVVKHRSKALKDFKLGYMGFVQSAPLVQGDFDTHEYYVPKTLPFSVNDTSFDFRDIQAFSEPFNAGRFFSAKNKNISDSNNLPDRFIQFLGSRDDTGLQRKVGYALGYSLVEGMTRPTPRADNVETPVWIWKSRKTYPQAIEAKMAPVVEAGTRFECTAYRQYFDATRSEHATCIHGHPEGDWYIFYADYHKQVEQDTIQLPKDLTGNAVDVVEKTPAVTLLSGETVPEAGITVSVTNDYGYIVLKVARPTGIIPTE